MPTYTAHFRTDAQAASYDFEANTPEQALQMARDLWMDDPERLLFEDYEMTMPVEEIAVYDLDGQEVAVWLADAFRLRLAAPQLLEALNDTDLDRAHDALSALLEDPDAGNDDIRNAALTLCDALCDFAEKRQKAVAMVTEADRLPEAVNAPARERPPSLRDLLKLALHALNEAPSFPVRHARYRNSYEICAAIEAALRERGDGSG